MSFKKTSFSLQKSSINFNGLLYYVVLDMLRDYFTVEILFRLFDWTASLLNLLCSSLALLLDRSGNATSLKQLSVKSAFRCYITISSLSNFNVSAEATVGMGYLIFFEGDNLLEGEFPNRIGFLGKVIILAFDLKRLFLNLISPSTLPIFYSIGSKVSSLLTT